MRRSFVTVIVPFSPQRASVVRGTLQGLGEEFTKKLDETKIIHFLSMTVIADEPNDQEFTLQGRAYLLIEFSADSAAGPALSTLKNSAGDTLVDVLRTAGLSCSLLGLPRFLEAHSYSIGMEFGFLWKHRRILGLPFDGLPGMTVERVKQEEQLARDIAAYFPKMRQTGALAKLQAIRNEIWHTGQMKWAFEPLHAPFLEPIRPGGSRLQISFGMSKIYWQIWLPMAAAFLSLAWLPLTSAFVFILQVFFATVLIALLSIVFLWRLIKRAEAGDPVNDLAPNPRTVSSILSRENNHPLNLLITVSPIKPNWFRPITLRAVFAAIQSLGNCSGRPGFLGPMGNIGTLHAGRWIVLPGTRALMFIAHYDGSWLSYMQDFVDRQPTGATAIWTNTVGFPLTRGLVSGGVQSGDRVTRWFHRQQRSIDFVYAASPDLTLSRIRTNAAIRRGFATAETEYEASAWLALFGGRSPLPKPPGEPQSTVGANTGPDPSHLDRLPATGSRVPTLAYGTLSHRHHAACLLIQLVDNDPAACRAWLTKISPHIGYGPASRHPEGSPATPPEQRKPTLEPVLALGLSPSGLRKLGLSASDLDTFPASFVDGMTSPGRARVLSDKPDEWEWGNEKFQPDAVVLVFACTHEGLRSTCREVTSTGLLRSRQILCEVRGQGPIVEPFGFRDGLSQPVIPGTRAFEKNPASHQIVAPGEFVLGYRDESGLLPPSPSVAATSKRLHGLDLLPDGRLDIGRDSSFLVVRQIQQHKHEFASYIARAAAKTKQNPETVAAKILGRWRDGSSLVRNPDQPGKKPDNDFGYSIEDADGLKCPKGAHIRRANPRDTLQTDPGAPPLNRHRLLRFGRPYVDGPDVNGKADAKGILFMCLNANIERQFELVQQAWMQNANFDSLRDEADPLTGGADRKFTVQSSEGPVCLQGLPRFVTVLGGGYFWMPGKKAVEFLTTATP